MVGMTVANHDPEQRGVVTALQPGDPRERDSVADSRVQWKPEIENDSRSLALDLDAAPAYHRSTTVDTDTQNLHNLAWHGHASADSACVQVRGQVRLRVPGLRSLLQLVC